MSDSLPVLILSREAEAYHACLREAAGLPCAVRWIAASSLEDLPDVATEISIAIGEPDLLAAAVRQLPALSWVQSTWAGVTPLLPAAVAGVCVTGIKDVFGQQMGEYALGHMLNHVLALPERQAAQQRCEWLERPTGTLSGKTLGVLGTGSIGAAIARHGRAFSMKTVGCSRSGSAHEDFREVFPVADLHDFLAGLDVLVAVLPDTPATAGLLDEAALRRLPAKAQLINVGRGTLIREQDLLRVLHSGHLSEVVLDVFETEPLPSQHPFWNAPRLRVTAHVAARSWPRDIAGIFVGNLARRLEGRALRYRLQPERGY